MHTIERTLTHTHSVSLDETSKGTENVGDNGKVRVA